MYLLFFYWKITVLQCRGGICHTSTQMSQLFASGGQSIEVSTSTSVLPMNTQD